VTQSEASALNAKELQRVESIEKVIQTLFTPNFASIPESAWISLDLKISLALKRCVGVAFMRPEPWPRPWRLRQGRPCGLDKSSPYKDQRNMVASNLRIRV